MFIIPHITKLEKNTQAIATSKATIADTDAAIQQDNNKAITSLFISVFAGAGIYIAQATYLLLEAHSYIILIGASTSSLFFIGMIFYGARSTYNYLKTKKHISNIRKLEDTTKLPALPPKLESWASKAQALAITLNKTVQQKLSQLAIMQETSKVTFPNPNAPNAHELVLNNHRKKSTHMWLIGDINGNVALFKKNIEKLIGLGALNANNEITKGHQIIFMGNVISDNATKEEDDAKILLQVLDILSKNDTNAHLIRGRNESISEKFTPPLIKKIARILDNHENPKPETIQKIHALWEMFATTLPESIRISNQGIYLSPGIYEPGHIFKTDATPNQHNFSNKIQGLLNRIIKGLSIEQIQEYNRKEFVKKCIKLNNSYQDILRPLKKRTISFQKNEEINQYIGPHEQDNTSCFSDDGPATNVSMPNNVNSPQFVKLNQQNRLFSLGLTRKIISIIMEYQKSLEQNQEISRAINFVGADRGRKGLFDEETNNTLIAFHEDPLTTQDSEPSEPTAESTQKGEEDTDYSDDEAATRHTPDIDWDKVLLCKAGGDSLRCLIFEESGDFRDVDIYPIETNVEED